jgi:hypothetical protein
MDNRYFKHGCPPLMQDGRFITSYTESRIVDQHIRNLNKLNSIQEYKHFLQTNGEAVINRERAYQQEMYTCGVQGKCVSLSGLSGSCGMYSNSGYGASTSCGNSK